MLWLWKIEQGINNRCDTFEAAIVAAASEEEAKGIHPSGDQDDWETSYPTWAENDPSAVTVTLIGQATPDMQSGVVLASFRAG